MFSCSPKSRSSTCSRRKSFHVYSCRARPPFGPSFAKLCVLSICDGVQARICPSRRGDVRICRQRVSVHSESKNRHVDTSCNMRRLFCTLATQSSVSCGTSTKTTNSTLAHLRGKSMFRRSFRRCRCCSRSNRLLGVSEYVFWAWQAPKRCTTSSVFTSGPNASLEGLFEKMCSVQPKKWHWHDLAMSAHAVQFTRKQVSLQLDHQQCQNFRPESRKCRKIKISFLTFFRFFNVLACSGGSMTRHVHDNCMKNGINIDSIGSNYVK